MIYVILPKQGEGPAWGITGDEILVVKATTGEKRYSKAQFKTFLECDNSSVSLPDACIVCYSDDCISTVEMRPSYREVLGKLLPVERRVFRHFGSSPLMNMSTSIMQAKMNEMDYEFWEERHVMPFSELGGSDAQFKWLPLIRDVREDCFKGSTLSVVNATSKLDEAWVLADGYFNALLPMRSMLETLFPLYLTLSGSEADEDKMAAVQAVRMLIESEAFYPVRMGIEANVGEEETGMRLSSNVSLPGSADKYPEFISWFRELSRAYTVVCTKEFSLGQRANPFEQSPQTPPQS
jgi:hypothetical protein